MDLWIPSFTSAGPSRTTFWLSGNNARCISCDEYRPARRMTIRSPSSSHCRTEPGPIPSFLRTWAGTEICPCAVTLECASAMQTHYHGNTFPQNPLVGARQRPLPRPQRWAAGPIRPIPRGGQMLVDLSGIHSRADAAMRYFIRRRRRSDDRQGLHCSHRQRGIGHRATKRSSAHAAGHGVTRRASSTLTSTWRTEPVLNWRGAFCRLKSSRTRNAPARRFASCPSPVPARSSAVASTFERGAVIAKIPFAIRMGQLAGVDVPHRVLIDPKIAARQHVNEQRQYAGPHRCAACRAPTHPNRVT